MLNVRGNIYSRQHENLEPFLTDFWDFSFHESAIFDYPAVIDYILNVTLSPDLSFVGYSMGATQYLILLSERPEYNEKIRAGYLLGAPAFIGEASHPVITMKEAMIMGKLSFKLLSKTRVSSVVLRNATRGQEKYSNTYRKCRLYPRFDFLVPESFFFLF